MQEFTIFLDLATHDQARERAATKTDEKISKQAYLDTLSLSAVCSVLRQNDFRVALDNRSNSHNPLFYSNPRQVWSDIYVKDLSGKIEIFSILNNSDNIRLPQEIIEDRLAYAYVRLDEKLTFANVIGFSKPKIHNIRVEELKPIDKLMDIARESMTTLIPIEPLPETASIINTQVSRGNHLHAAGFSSSHVTNSDIRSFEVPGINETLKIVKKSRKIGEIKNEILIELRFHDREDVLPIGCEISLLNKDGVYTISDHSYGKSSCLKLTFNRSVGKTFRVRFVFSNFERIEEFVSE